MKLPGSASRMQKRSGSMCKSKFKSNIGDLKTVKKDGHYDVIDNDIAVSYTHLTLPTIYSV